MPCSFGWEHRKKQSKSFAPVAKLYTPGENPAMHEYAVTESLIELALREGHAAGLSKLKEVHVELGALSTYKAESISFYFDLLKEDHAPLKECRLRIECVAGAVCCRQCGREYPLNDAAMIICPKCHTPQVSITAGRDFLLRRIVGEKTDEQPAKPGPSGD